MKVPGIKKEKRSCRLCVEFCGFFLCVLGVGILFVIFCSILILCILLYDKIGVLPR